MTYVLLTDTSHWSGDIDFAKMYAAGARGWITKATDANRISGLQFQDSRFNDYCLDAFAFGKLLTGCYHWLQCSVDPTMAADFYLERYKRFRFDFPPVLDFEEKYAYEKVLDDRTIVPTHLESDYAWRAQVWLERVRDKTGRTPIIYTAQWFTYHFADKLISWMGAYPLWVADYSYWSNNVTLKPRMPSPWKGTDPLIWQFSADGNTRGPEFGTTSKSIDLNMFYGSENDLRRFCGIDVPEVPQFAPKKPRWSQRRRLLHFKNTNWQEVK